MEELKDKQETKKPVVPAPIPVKEVVAEPVPVVEPPKPKPVKPVVLTYKANLYRLNGQLRTEISKAVMYDMSKKYGDIISAVAANKFHTIDEVCDAVWAAERRNFNRGHDRTRPSIEKAVVDLVEAGLFVTRST